MPSKNVSDNYELASGSSDHEYELASDCTDCGSDFNFDTLEIARCESAHTHIIF